MLGGYPTISRPGDAPGAAGSGFPTPAREINANERTGAGARTRTDPAARTTARPAIRSAPPDSGPARAEPGAGRDQHAPSPACVMPAPRGGGPRRVVCYAFFRLLRSFALRCASSSRAAEGQVAQQRERGAADAGADGPAVIAVHGAAAPLASSDPSAPPVSSRARADSPRVLLRRPPAARLIAGAGGLVGRRSGDPGDAPF